MAKVKKRGKIVRRAVKKAHQKLVRNSRRIVRGSKKVIQKLLGGRKPSRKTKASKVRKLIQLAKLGKSVRRKKGKKR